MDRTMRRRVNLALYPLGKKLFETVGSFTDILGSVLQGAGLDHTVLYDIDWHIYYGESKRLTFDIATNCQLVVSLYRHFTGRYEVIPYVS